MASGLSAVSSLKDDSAPLYVQPHYKESYRLAIYALLCGGTEAYEEFLRAEQISHFLSEQEIAFLLDKAELPVIEDEAEIKADSLQIDGVSTYFPTESDEEIPDLDLGWPEVPLEETDTSISVLFNPPRQDTPTIKEVVRKQIQDSVQLIAMSMDVFTDVDIFKELVTAALRGVVVYLLLDQTHFSSFIFMAQRLGVSLSDIKTLRVRTVQGLQYRCQSSMKLHGALEQKFLLVDCRTVLYGSYSYTWTYEKLNLSMMLVITGQLVSSYDEEFRRLYARSTVPPLLSREKLHPIHYLHSPSSSQLSLHQLYVKNKGMNGFRDDRFNNNNVLTRGVSMQDRLHQFPEMGNLVRGHSYGGELQKFNSMTRLRMGTKDFGLDRQGGAPRPNELQNRSLQQHLRHQSRYGADHNLIPFSSETSLNKWKMDAYLNAPLDASHEALSPVGSPYSSYTGLNELPSQNIHLRSKDIRQRIEETRQKRLSLQEYANLQQSQESLRTMYLTQERKIRSRGMELRQSAADLEAFANQTNHRNIGELGLTNGKRSMSHNDFKSMTDRKLLTYDWHDSVTRSTSDLDLKTNDSVGKLGLGPKQQRHMESLSEIPEEKEVNSRVNSSDLVPQKEDLSKKDNKVVSFEEQKKMMKDVQVSTSKTAESPTKESKKSTHNEGSNGPKKKVSQHSDTKSKETEKLQDVSTLPRRNSKEVEKTQDSSTLPRKNSVKSKETTVSSPDEKRQGKKELLQRKPSLRLQKLSGSNQSLRTESSSSTIGKQEQMSKKSLKSPMSPTDEKGKSPLSRFSPQRLSKRKTDSEKGSKSALNDEVSTSFEARKEKAYSRYEYLLGREDKSSRRLFENDTEKSASLNRQSDGNYQIDSQTQNAAGENKIGKFMQRMGNLIGKSK